MKHTTWWAVQRQTTTKSANNKIKGHQGTSSGSPDDGANESLEHREPEFRHTLTIKPIGLSLALFIGYLALRIMISCKKKNRQIKAAGNKKETKSSNLIKNNQIVLEISDDDRASLSLPVGGKIHAIVRPIMKINQLIYFSVSRRCSSKYKNSTRFYDDMLLACML